MSTDLEVDDSTKSLIASWFGVDSINTSGGLDLEETTVQEKIQNKKKKKEKPGSLEGKDDRTSETNQNLQVFSLGLPKKKTVSSFVGDKLQKKLKKLKNKQESAQKEIQENTPEKSEFKKVKGSSKKEKKDDSDDDCSKVKVIEKMNKTPVEFVYTVESLRKLLNEPNDFTKNRKKKLRKKLHKLLQLQEKDKGNPPTSTDRLGRLAQHLITQHGYYPLYPPSDEVNIDYEALDTYGTMPVTPHVLILPSDLKQFIKELHGSFCINPGRVAKGQIGGSYARMIIKTCDMKSQTSIFKHAAAQILRV